MTYTKGPWVLEFSGGETRLIANGDCIMCDMCYYPWTPDNISDWHLIAAAPELLEALEKSMNFIANTESEIGDTLECGDMARAAISKAKGEAK